MATVTSKGQITIPLEIRERYGIETGARVEFVAVDDHGFECIPRTGSVMALAGVLAHDGPSRTIEELDDDIGEYLREEDERTKGYG